MGQALDSMRVLELGSGMAGAMAGMVLAENGADVIRVEPPGGDPERERPGALVWHRGKRSIVLDLRDAEGRARFVALAQRADGLIETLRPGAATRLGVDYEALAPIAPRLVQLSITGFGERGPLRDLPGYEGIVAAVTGRMALQTGNRPGPIFTPVPIASFGAAMLGVEGLLAALHARRTTGRGQRVHTSLLHALSVYDMTIGYGNRTHAAPRPGLVYGVMRVCFMTAPTKDGRFIQMCSRQPHLFRNWLEAMGLEALLSEPDLNHIPDLFPSEARLAEVVALIEGRMRTRTLDEWMEIFSSKDVGADPFYSAGEFLDHPQAKENGRRQVVVDPKVGETIQIGPLGLFSQTPSRIGRPAPALGADQAAVLALLGESVASAGSRESDGGSSAASVAGSHASATSPVIPPRRPLEGVVLIDCGYFYATPFAATLLAEAGAKIVKVEPAEGDPGRRNWTASYSKAMVGKESIVVDLKTAEGRAIVHDLVARADVFLHNFRPGTPERLGIDDATLRGINPRLLYVYGSCFGSRGPWSHKPGFHSSPNAIVGPGVIEAGSGNPPQNRTYADPASALATAAAILVGLHAREETGRGQSLETTMLTSMAYAVSEWSLRYAGKRDREVDPGQHGFGALHRLYETQAGWLFLEVHREGEWRALCEVVDPALAADVRFSTPAARRANDDALATVLGERLRGRDAEAWQTLLLAAGVPALRADGIDHAAFMLEHPHCRANGIAVVAQQPGTPLSARAGPAIEFGEHPTPIEPAAELGGQTVQVLRWLGRSESEIEALAARGVTRAVGNALPS
ncbi:MAG: CoA transferase [Deltaproteobacteria bacterium]|nr:CoA transferase [Deltaproteobacteria bacterium]